jgi:predicted Ser/Thr protein kinase
MERIGLAAGTEVGGYVVIGPVGQGGMGAVYRARDADGRQVALKLLHPHLTEGPGRERLAREVAALQRVRHPAVARVLDAELDQAEAFVVTELLDGLDLAAHVEALGPLDPDALADLAERLREALDAVHGAGVLHRDLTPANVLLTHAGPVIIDFGIAQAVEDARVTTAGQVAGTPGYLCPEVLDGAEPSAAADWWGWAAVLAFAATGRPPFGVRPLAAVLARVRAGEADLDGAPETVAAVLAGALAVEPARRTAPAAVVAGLRAAAAAPGPRRRPTGRTGPVAVVAPRAGDGEATAAGATEVLAAGGDEAGATEVLPAGGDEAGATEVLPAEGDGAGATAVLPAEGAGPGSTAVLPVGSGPTAVLPVGGPGPGPAELDEDDADADAGFDEGDAFDTDLERDDEDDAEPASDVPPLDPPRRTGTVLAAGVLLAVVGCAWPGTALVVALALAVLARSVGLDALALHARRARRGSWSGGGARAVLLWPWYLVRAAVEAVPAAAVAASAVLVVGGVGWWAIGSGRWTVAAPAEGADAGPLDGNAPWVATALVGIAVAVGLVVLWFGPMGRSTRLGARVVLDAVLPGLAGAAALVAVLLVAAVLVAWLVVPGHEIAWWPLPGAPDLN